MSDFIDDFNQSFTDDELWGLIERCQIPTLKSLLSKGGIPTTARKENLQWRLFYAIRLGLPVVPTKEDNEVSRREARAKKLVISPQMCVPHPLTLDSWENSPKNFPDVLACDVESYFKSCNERVGVTTGGQKALKEGKSMSVSDGRVTSLQYHPISPFIGLCYLSGMVVPQTRINDKPYYVWALVFKQTGVVHQADCHCIAGLSGMCKHVAALLFSVADHVAKGHNKACTSKEQLWHRPPAKVQKTALLADIKTPKASSGMGNPIDKAASRRDQFDPRCSEHQRKRTLGDYRLDELAHITNGKAAALLYADIFRDQNALHELPDIRFPVVEVEVVSSTLTNLETIVEAVMSDKELVVSTAQQQWLAEITCEQSESGQWFAHREGRITSSNVGNVLPHVDDANKITGSTHSVTATVMGYYQLDPDRLPKPLRWGRSNEAKAIARYCQSNSSHRGFQFCKTGLWVSVKHPFLAASPDGLVECKCCGKGVVEVKCPWTSRDLTITAFVNQKDSYLESDREHITLKKRHTYYSQVQLQMYCSNRTYCDFVVWTTASTDNICILRIAFDQEFADTMTEKSSVFWQHVILPEIRERCVKRKLDKSREAKLSLQIH